MRKALVTSVCVLWAAGLAGGEDMFPPSWRGESRTLFAVWDNWQGDLLPDQWSSNPPQAKTPYAIAGPGTVVYQQADGRTNVVEMTQDFQLGFYLPNIPGGTSKEIILQVTYYVDAGFNPQVLPQLEFASGEWGGQIEDYYPHGEGWITDVIRLEIEPNPEEEWIYLYARDQATWQYAWYPTYIDQVVIDTMCIPEPATLGLLAAGAAALLRRRRKR